MLDQPLVVITLSPKIKKKFKSLPYKEICGLIAFIKENKTDSLITAQIHIKLTKKGEYVVIEKGTKEWVLLENYAKKLKKSFKK